MYINLSLPVKKAVSVAWVAMEQPVVEQLPKACHLKYTLHHQYKTIPVFVIKLKSMVQVGCCQYSQECRFNINTRSVLLSSMYKIDHFIISTARIPVKETNMLLHQDVCPFSSQDPLQCLTQ